MPFRFGNPIFLVLLAVLLPLVLWTGSRLTLLTRFRRVLIVATRVAIVVLLVLSIARIQRIRTSDILDVFFVVDGSDSVAEDQKQKALSFVQDELGTMRSRDRAGILVFGRNAYIEDIPTPFLEKQRLDTEPDREGTDIGEALRLAMAALTGEHKKRIVLITDGNENEGAAIKAAESARAHRIPVDIVPLTYDYRNDVIVESVIADSRTHVDEPFDLRMFVRSDEDTSVTLNIYRDNQLISTQEERLEANKKETFVLPTQVDTPGFHVYRVHVGTRNDRNLDNNQGFAYTFAGGPPRVLLVDGNPPKQDRLVPILQSEKILVDHTDAEGLPDDLGALQSYDTVILSNVPAGDVGQRRMKILEQAVHELGVGLVMIGGENSFGAGGYQDTPVERALPVSMDVAHKKILPRGALVVILHTCEIAEGNSWARKIALAALDVMSSRDLMGLLYFGVPAGGGPAVGWGEQWLYTLQEVGNKSRMRSLIKQCMPGDMPNMANTIRMGYGALANCNASVKHMVLITDGDPIPPSTALLNKLKKDNITLSCVGISPHRPTDVQILATMAKHCGGNFYNVQNPNMLPRIFIKEASLVRKPLLCEEPFKPVLKAYSPVLAGIDGAELPQLKGYVCTTPKALADKPIVSDKDDPVLAHWQYGVGKSVAFTSDAQSRWASSWLPWGKFAKFWTQAVRWTLRGQLSQNFQMRTEIEEGRGRVVVDAVDIEGNFINFLDFQGSVIDPKLERQPLAFKQTGPGRYEAAFPVGETGSYLVSARGDAGEGARQVAGLITGGLAVPYSPEYKDSKSNDGLLRQIAAITGGRQIEPGSEEQPETFSREGLVGGSQPEPFWPRTLALAILLIPLDVFFRRVMIDWRDVARAWNVSVHWLGSLVQTILARRPRKREEAIAALFQAKEKVRERHAQETRAPSEAFLAALDQAKQRATESVLDQIEQPAPEGRKPVIVHKSEKDEVRSKPKAPAETFTSRLLDAKKRARQKK